MILGIDASNIRAGGGVTHMRELLGAATPADYGFKRVIIWSGKATLDLLPNASWLQKEHVAVLDGNQIGRVLWQRFRLPRIAVKACSLLFVPGGNYHGGRLPFVPLSQNLLPFDAIERKKYGLSWTRFRLYLLNRGQKATFRKASGMMFLTETARRVVEGEIGPISAPTVIVPHGIGSAIRRQPPKQEGTEAFSNETPFRWLYVSIVNLYKHQWHVVEAVANLRREGFPMTLDLVGPAHPQGLKRLQGSLAKWDPDREFVRYLGPRSHDDLANMYHAASGFVFASSCENMPIILLEAMSAGLPIACANRGPMPEVLGNGGVYFDPENPVSIGNALRELYLDPSRRAFCAKEAAARAEKFSWSRCAAETFGFLADVARKYN